MFKATKQKVLNRGVPPDSFLMELVDWARTAPNVIFEANPNPADIYAAVKATLGPWQGLTHRKAVMLEVMRVLAGFESSWNWREGVDSTRVSADTPANSEAGAWQVSADSLAFGDDLRILVHREAGALAVTDGRKFQVAMKENHPLAMEYVARLMRRTTGHNGPLYKDRHRFKPALRGEEHSIYPWLRADAVTEFADLLTA